MSFHIDEFPFKYFVSLKDVQIQNLNIWEFTNDGKVVILLLQYASLLHVMV